MRVRLAIAFLAMALSDGAAAQAPPDGARVFQQCYACHSVDPKETGLPGPNLAGIVGRPAAREAGFAYSPALRAAAAADLVWSEARLDRFLADPEAMIPRTEMGFVGLRSAAERKAVIDYLAGERPSGRR